MMMLIFFFLLLFAPAARASMGSGLCMEDLYGDMGLNCVGNDLTFAIVEAMGSPLTCTLGENITAHLRIHVMTTATVRYDIGMVIALDGGTGYNGTCANFNLEPASLTNMDLNVTGGFGPYYNGETASPLDVCGDIRKIDPVNIVDIGEVTFLCVDNNFDGYADLAGGVAWSNGASMGTPMSPHCTGPDDAGPETKSKCHQDSMNIMTMLVVDNSTTMATMTEPPTTTTDASTSTTGTSISTSSTTDASTTTTDTSTSTSTTDASTTTTGSTSTTGTGTSTITGTTTSGTTLTTGPGTTSTSTFVPTTAPSGGGGGGQPPFWILAPVLGGTFVVLVFFFIVCGPVPCVWFDPRAQRRFSATLVNRETGTIYRRYYRVV